MLLVVVSCKLTLSSPLVLRRPAHGPVVTCAHQHTKDRSGDAPVHEEDACTAGGALRPNNPCDIIAAEEGGAEGALLDYFSLLLTPSHSFSLFPTPFFSLLI
eukprot:Sspe_Gene.38924::Locus_18764_Transcript_1_1_Confidence_1.000_Length_4070::g.38924::m.38924